MSCAELLRVKRQLETAQAQLSRGDSIMRELQSREADLQETVAAKDSQIGVLRVRFEEVERELQEKNKSVDELRVARDRYLNVMATSSTSNIVVIGNLIANLFSFYGIVQVYRHFSCKVGYLCCFK